MAVLASLQGWTYSISSLKAVPSLSKKEFTSISPSFGLAVKVSNVRQSILGFVRASVPEGGRKVRVPRKKGLEGSKSGKRSSKSGSSQDSGSSQGDSSRSGKNQNSANDAGNGGGGGEGGGGDGGRGGDDGRSWDGGEGSGSRRGGGSGENPWASESEEEKDSEGASPSSSSSEESLSKVLTTLPASLTAANERPLSKDWNKAEKNGGGDDVGSTGTQGGSSVSTEAVSGEDAPTKPPLDGFFGALKGLVWAVTGQKEGEDAAMTPERKKQLEAQLERQTLVDEVALLALQLMDRRSGEQALARRSEVSALRRLVREAFTDLLNVRERVDKLELHTGLRRLGSGPSAASEGGGVRTRLTGEVNAGAAFLPAEGENSQEARSLLEKAGMRSGLGVKFRFETPCREADVLLTECTAGLGEASSPIMLGGPITLHKVLYTAHLQPGLLLRFAPLGAHGWDMADTLNPLQNRALTRFASEGSPLHGHAKGSAIGLSLKGSAATLTCAQFLSGWGAPGNAGTPAVSDPESNGLCASTLAQIALQPHDRLLLAFSVLNRMWPAPPVPSNGGLHWSELGPLVLPKLQWRPKQFLSESKGSESSSITSLNGNESVLWEPPHPEAGTALQSISVSGALGLGPSTTLAAWAQADQADWLADNERHRMLWALSLAHTPTKGRGAVGWGFSLGSGLLDGSLQSYDENCDESSNPLQMEAFVRLRCGRGLSLQPGVVLATSGKSSHHALMLRSTLAL